MINCEREKLEFESLPEFIREPYSSARESYVPSSSSREPYVPPATTRRTTVDEFSDAPLHKTAELEALWPGVNHQDFLQASRKAPSFYLTIGFMAGALISIIGLSLFSVLSHMSFAKLPISGGNKVVVAGATNAGAQATNGASGQITTRVSSGPAELVIPLYPTYEVKSGDTLAAIALQSYKRVSPRLLDAICRANGMRSAHVLSLGQRLVLPEYRPQTSQIATGSGQIQ